jgi:hypothetical protein
MLVTYAHHRLDTGQVFYIGKGSLRRAHEQRGHNRYWNSVVAKHGYKVSVLAQWSTDAEAFEHEKFLIACFKELGHPLTNATNGGEGVSGWTWTESQRAKLVASLTGRAGTFKGKKHSPKSLALISQKLKGRISPRKGVVFSEEERKAASARAKLQFSSEEARAKQRESAKAQMRAIFADGENFESIHAFAKYTNQPIATIHRWVSRGWQEKLDAAVAQQRKKNDFK